MKGFFRNCFSLKEIDIGNWKIHNVEDMYIMFYLSKNIKDLLYLSYIPTMRLLYTNDMFTGW